MVDQMTLQTTISLLTLISLTIGVVYHIMTLRNARKNQEMQLETRQAQLFMNLFESFRGIDYRRIAHQVMVYDWKDFDDWTERYNERTNPEAIAAFSSVMLFYGGIGVLIRRGLVDIGLVYELMAMSIKAFWSRYEPIIRGDREFFQNPQMWGDFEYLYNKVIEIDESPETIDFMKNYYQQLSQTNS